MATVTVHAPEWRVDRHGSEAELRLGGDWIAHETGLRNAADLREVLAGAGDVARLRLEASGIGHWDSALIAFVHELRNAASAEHGRRIEFDLCGIPVPAQRLLALAGSGGETQPAEARSRRAFFLTRTGEASLRSWHEVVVFAALVGETFLRGPIALVGRAQTRAVDVFQLMREAGAEALGIVAIVNGLVGAILAFVGAVQLRRFGAGVFVADLVGIAMVREMTAVMTAIIMTGRTGGAYAAHLAAMQGNEEIDALKALGISVHEFLVLPRIAALVTMMPLLYIYACAVGLLSGFVVSVAILDLTNAVYLEELRTAVAGRQFTIGLTKSVAFGALVALASCHIGLRAGRSAADVGRAATTAVVVGVIGIIALDAFFAVCANALGV
jgi:phospholipid/cholesterol/gamma-HCH transport system permease protein